MQQTLAPLTPTDLNRDRVIPVACLMRQLESTRFGMPFLANTGALNEMEPKKTRSIVVASQMLRLLGAQDFDKEGEVQTEICHIRGASMDIKERLLQDGRLLATNAIVWVMLADMSGKFRPDTIPEEMARMGNPGSSSDDFDFMKQSLASLPKTPPKNTYGMPVLLRFSDEDPHMHANHCTYGRLFEDAKHMLVADAASNQELQHVARQPLEALMVSYMAEAFACDQLEVRVAMSQPQTLDLWAVRIAAHPNGAKPGVVARGRLFCKGCSLPPIHGLGTRSARL